MHFSAALIAASVKPCIVIVFDLFFKNALTFHPVVILLNAGVILKSAEFLVCTI